MISLLDDNHQTQVLQQPRMRSYSPVLGRWINRDPIGENGEVNVYGFIWNSPLIENDFLGLDSNSLACCQDGHPVNCESLRESLNQALKNHDRANKLVCTMCSGIISDDKLSALLTNTSLGIAIANRANKAASWVAEVTHGYPGTGQVLTRGEELISPIGKGASAALEGVGTGLAFVSFAYDGYSAGSNLHSGNYLAAAGNAASITINAIGLEFFPVAVAGALTDAGSKYLANRIRQKSADRARKIMKRECDKALKIRTQYINHLMAVKSQWQSCCGSTQ